MEETWLKTMSEGIQDDKTSAGALQPIDDEHHLGRPAIALTDELAVEACLSKLPAYEAAKLGLQPTLLSNLTLLPPVRERLIETFLTIAAFSGIGRKVSSLQSAVALSCTVDSDLRVLAYILAENALFVFTETNKSEWRLGLEQLVSTLKPEISDLRLEGRSHALQVWIALLEAQSMLIQGKPESAIAHLRSVRRVPSPALSLRVGRCVMVNDGRYELILLEGLIHYQAGDFMAAWPVFTEAFIALGNVTWPMATIAYSKLLLGTFVRLICVESPGFTVNMSRWTSLEQALPVNHDHRTMLYWLARYLYDVVTQPGPLDLVDAIIWRYTEYLNEAPVTAVSTYLSRVLEVTRQFMLYKGSGLSFDHSQELAKTRSALNPSAWLGPAVIFAP